MLMILLSSLRKPFPTQFPSLIMHIGNNLPFSSLVDNIKTNIPQRPRQIKSGPISQAIPLIMKEVYACGKDASLGFSVPKVIQSRVFTGGNISLSVL